MFIKIAWHAHNGNGPRSLAKLGARWKGRRGEAFAEELRAYRELKSERGAINGSWNRLRLGRILRHGQRSQEHQAGKRKAARHSDTRKPADAGVRNICSF